MILHLLILLSLSLQLKSVYQKPPGVYSSGEEQKFHTNRVYALRFHPHQREIFVSGGWEDIIKVT